MTPEEISEQVSRFEKNRPKYVSLSRSFKSLFRQLLEAKSIDYVTIEARAKTMESFEEKISREDKDYSNPIDQITDLAGIRIVAYQIEDIDHIDEIIRNNFEIDEENSIDKRQSIEIDRFGYISVHYIVRLKEDRTKLPEYECCKDLCAEIQVRTVLQHAWAAIDHKLKYKSKKEIPAKLRRQLYRISALLETADEQFDTLTKKIKKVKDGYSDSVSTGSLDMPLDIDSLGAYANVNEHARILFTSAEDAGMSMSPHRPFSKSPEYSHLLYFLSQAKVRTVSEFDKCITNTSFSSENIIKMIVKSWRDKVESPYLRLMFTKDSLLRIIYFMKQPPQKAKKLIPYFRVGNTLREAVEKTYRDLHEAPDFQIADSSHSPHLAENDIC